MVRARGAKGRPSRRPGSQRVMRRVDSALRGTKVEPAQDPPDFVASPWWPVTIPILHSGETLYTYGDVHKALLDYLTMSKYQDGQKNTLPVQIRVLEIRAWTTSAKQAIQLEIFDMIDPNSGTGKAFTVLAEINDYGSPIHYGKVGWRFGGMAHMQAGFKDDKALIFRLAASTTVNYIGYINVLWRVTSTGVPKFQLLAINNGDTDVESDPRTDYSMCTGSHSSLSSRFSRMR